MFVIVSIAAEKIHRNRIRDHDTLEKLLDAGWRVAIVWECAVKSSKKENLLATTVAQLVPWLTSNTPELELPPPIELPNPQWPRRS